MIERLQDVTKEIKAELQAARLKHLHLCQILSLRLETVLESRADLSAPVNIEGDHERLW